MNNNNQKWQKDSATKEHQLIVDGGFYAVVHSVAGDWYAGFNPDNEPCITDESMEYFDSWQQGRKYCEERYKSGKDK